MLVFFLGLLLAGIGTWYGVADSASFFHPEALPVDKAMYLIICATFLFSSSIFMITGWCLFTYSKSDQF